ncbi:P-loop NTPase fold protein [Micavibrio aeruginosavorus]|uniref:P-loop NTPase fold protein n=1 Tax=Micavibrio aeruginosavorus TaxID=349221 RepID=UPI003F4AD811
MYKILYDTPVEDVNDSGFSNHKDIAEAIVRIVNHNNGGSIALLGPWGSGKSSIIKMVEGQICKNDSKNLFFIYDSWRFENDPSRVSFLQELLNSVPADKFKHSEYGDELEAIKTGRTIQKNKIKIDFWSGLFFCVYACSVAVAASSLAEDLAHFMSQSALVSSMYILSILALFIWPVSLLIGGSDRFGKMFPFAFFKNADVFKEVLTEHEDQTATRFRIFFERILGGASFDKIVIVIDNLDRLSPNKAQEVWSSLQGIFLQQAHENLWVIAPFLDDKLAKGSGVGGKAFVDKFFDITLHVQPALLLDKQNFIEEKLREILEADSGSAVERISKLYSSLSGESMNSDKTPREIIKFCNELLALRAVWEGVDIPVTTMAVFILRRSDVLKMLLDKNFLGSLSRKDKRLVGDQFFEKNMAALHYGVRPERAIHVLLYEQIENCLLKSARLNEGGALNDANHYQQELIKLMRYDGALSVLREIVTDKISYWVQDIDKVLNVFSSLSGLNSYFLKDQREFQAIYSEILNEISHYGSVLSESSSWGGFSQDPYSILRDLMCFTHPMNEDSVKGYVITRLMSVHIDAHDVSYSQWREAVQSVCSDDDFSNVNWGLCNVEALSPDALFFRLKRNSFLNHERVAKVFCALLIASLKKLGGSPQTYAQEVFDKTGLLTWVEMILNSDLVEPEMKGEVLSMMRGVFGFNRLFLKNVEMIAK